MNHAETAMQPALKIVYDAARNADVFAEITAAADLVRCRARNSAAEAWYTASITGDTWTISLQTPDRWLSESIESDLMHYGDPIEELLEEELVELDWTGPTPAVRHFRSEDRLYTFVSELATSGDPTRDARAAVTLLLAYEATFRELGDMTADDDDDSIVN